MERFYSSIFITNIPSFYKLNLYNEVNKYQRVLVIFTGDLREERALDFFKGEYHFDYIDMTNWTLFEKISTLTRILSKIDYKELIIGGWDSVPLIYSAIISPTNKNAVVVESNAIRSTTRGLKGIIKKLYFRNISRAYASGKSQARLVKMLGPKIKDILITKGVGIFNYVVQPVFKEKVNISKFLYVGRLSEEKNLFFLINVFNQLPQFTLNIIGYGDLEKELKAIAKNNINFLGGIDNTQLSEYYQDNDVFILPSKAEAWGLVVEEALNNGLPVLLSNQVGCAEEILVEGVNGYLFDYDNEESLIAGIRQISKPSIYNRMAEYISHMDFNKIEEEQAKCYIRE